MAALDSYGLSNDVSRGPCPRLNFEVVELRPANVRYVRDQCGLWGHCHWDSPPPERRLDESAMGYQADSIYLQSSHGIGVTLTHRDE